MIKAGSVILIREAPGAHGVFETVTESTREVPCVERSLGLRRIGEAKAAGMSPEIVLDLAHEFEYQGEKKCLYQGIEYKIIHAYPYERNNGIELLLERREGNADV